MDPAGAGQDLASLEIEMIVEEEADRIIQRGRRPSTCGLTKRNGRTMCEALRSNTSRSASALATSRNS
jgi:hypothetical protein